MPTLFIGMVVSGSRDERVTAYVTQLAQWFGFHCIVLTGSIAHRTDLRVTQWCVVSKMDHGAAVMKRIVYTAELRLESKKAYALSYYEATYGALD